MNETEEVKARVTIPQLLRQYGIKEGYARRIPCPLHHGKNKNFSYTDNKYHCFKCGAKGDVISFVMDYFALSFPEALKKLDNDFLLGLSNPLTRMERLEFQKKERNRRELERKKAKELSEINKKCDAAMAEYKRLSEQLRLYAPKSPDEELNPLYIEAIHKIDYAEFVLDTAEAERSEHERGKS